MTTVTNSNIIASLTIKGDVKNTFSVLTRSDLFNDNFESNLLMAYTIIDRLNKCFENQRVLTYNGKQYGLKVVKDNQVTRERKKFINQIEAIEYNVITTHEVKSEPQLKFLLKLLKILSTVKGIEVSYG